MNYRWYIVWACFLISFYMSGSINLGFTAFFEPLAAEMGWSHTQLSLATSLRGLETGLLAPFAGVLMDRWGPRSVVASGVFLSGLGLILVSRTTSLAVFYIAFIFVAAGLGAASSTLLMTVVTRWFRARSGLAMGLAASGVAFGGMLIPLISWLIDVFGWRWAMVALSLGMWLVPLPLSFVLGSPAEPSKPETEPGLAKAPNLKGRYGFPGRDVLGSRYYWIVVAAFFCHIMAVSAVMTHIMPYLGDVGVQRQAGSLIAGAMPLMTIVGRIGFGALGDLIDKRTVAALSLVLTVSVKTPPPSPTGFSLV